jgi:hypothetical protein
MRAVGLAKIGQAIDIGRCACFVEVVFQAVGRHAILHITQ